jgi:hypothetical protein
MPLSTMIMKTGLSTLAVCIAGLLSTATTFVTAAEIDFAHEIVPILREHCSGCHGGKEAKGSFSINNRELIEQSGHVAIGSAKDSHLVSLIRSADAESQMPPPGRPRLTPTEMEKLERWVNEGLDWQAGFSFGESNYEPPLRPRRPILPPVSEGRTNPIDRIVGDYFATTGIAHPQPLDDSTFLRRASLDLVGLLPEPEQLAQFLNDRSPDKRERLIDKLLENRIAYADHWLSFFNDLLRNDYSGTGFITGGRSQISGWLYDSLLNNLPFDEMARELISPSSPASRGYIDGIRWRGEVSAGQTVDIQFAQSIAQSFLGINMKCASCHDSFIDRWKLDEAYGLAAVYANQPLEIHRCDKPIGKQAKASWLFPELGQIDPSATREERLRQLADLMTHPENGRFTRTIVNRLWYKMMGRGIVHPMDAMQSPPWNEDLLDQLAIDFAASGYDLKSTLRLIASSLIYQSKSVEPVNAPNATYRFHGPEVRRLTAEQFLDGVWQLTGAAPTRMDAPVPRGLADESEINALRLQAKWIWGHSAAEGKVPPQGESLAFRKTIELGEPIRRGGAIVDCDNSYVLYVNGNRVAQGEDWTQPDSVVLHHLLRKGKNDVVIIGTNAGDAPNPAGLYFEARLISDSGNEIIVASDDSWRFNDKVPAGREGRLGPISGEWQPVVVSSGLDVWRQAIENQGRLRLVHAISKNTPMIRASLMKNDFFMKSLGRPLREQIVSMRPAELTTLEAVDLANGQKLAEALSQGAQRLADRDWVNQDFLVDHIFRFALSRPATPSETAVAREFLEEGPHEEGIQDLLWSVFMSPEFFLIR